MVETIVATGVKFHVGLHVADRRRAATFYRVLFGVEPAKDVEDHIRFELETPPLVVVLVESQQQPGGALNHLGLRVRDAAELVTIQRRLEEGGHSTQRQDGVECCYARQTKFWVSDPDYNLWEIYVFEEDLDHSGFEDVPARREPAAAVVWEHRLTEPLPERIDRADAGVEEVRLEGSFNVDVSLRRMQAFLAEVCRVLQPGGRLAVHGLFGDRPFQGKPQLPGLASLVQHIPSWNEVAETLHGAGFGGLFFEKLGDIHCFRVNGVELREAQLFARRSADVDPKATGYVVYKGPVATVTDDDGNVYPRGERVSVSDQTRGCGFCWSGDFFVGAAGLLDR
jgi:catechol 2,3-dioxygenase-like lactoylglutathione lyase family enzyme